jgi:hypothetical protein
MLHRRFTLHCSRYLHESHRARVGALEAARHASQITLHRVAFPRRDKLSSGVIRYYLSYASLLIQAEHSCL